MAKKKFNLSAEVTISVYTSVEAESLEEAIEIAENRSVEQYRLGDKHQANKVWVSEEFDGFPCEIKES